MGVVSLSYCLRSFCLVLALSLLIPSLARSQAPGGPPPELEARVDMGVVTATGFEPGAEVVVFGVARVPAGYVTRVMPRASRLEADETGTLVFEAVPASILPAAEGEIAEIAVDPTAQSVWMVVDPVRGDYAVLSPDGSRVRERPFSPQALRQGPSGLVDRLAQELDEGHLLLVRPTESGEATKDEGSGEGGEGSGEGTPDEPTEEPAGPVGVWALTLEDGSHLDLDGARDGSFEVELADWWPVGEDPELPEPPEEVLAGDLIFVVQPTTLEFSVLRFVGQGGASR